MIIIHDTGLFDMRCIDVIALVAELFFHEFRYKLAISCILNEGSRSVLVSLCLFMLVYGIYLGGS